jgi:hypothetical protein
MSNPLLPGFIAWLKALYLPHMPQMVNFQLTKLLPAWLNRRPDTHNDEEAGYGFASDPRASAGAAPNP